MQSSYTKHNINDYIGKKFGHLTVIGQSLQTHKYSNKFDFQCDCGNVISKIPSRVLYGHTTSCGKCEFRSKTSSPLFNINDYIGKRFNMLTVIGIAERKPKDNHWYLLCKCDCENTIRATIYQIKSGKIKSCGCLRRVSPSYVDGKSNHPLYGTWLQMISRCENPNHDNYCRYGGRGISVCEEWHDFWKFVEWSDSVGGRPNGYTLDRKNNNGNYEPSNCRWASFETQASNKSSNIFLTYKDKTLTIKQWADLIGEKHQTLLNRYKKGWCADKIIETPVVHKNGNKTRFMPVIQSEKDGTIVCKYENISHIPSEYSRKCIIECCNGRKKSYKGFIWKYAEDD